MSTAPRTVLVPIATGSEELEAVAVIDILVRAGAAVTVASVSGSLQVTCSRGVKLVADALLDELADTAYDAIVLPGGMPGAEHLANSAALERMLRAHAAAGRLTAAICAAPVVVLQKHGLLAGRAATAHPAFSDKLPDQAAVPTRVVVRRATPPRRRPQRRPTPAPRARSRRDVARARAPCAALGAGGRPLHHEPRAGHRRRVCAGSR
jgi:4-methyl-5(b-hydroxyethyl)-thiazole monophosphate biosynthesis